MDEILIKKFTDEFTVVFKKFKNSGGSQIKFAQMAGISQAYVSQILNGERTAERRMFSIFYNLNKNNIYFDPLKIDQIKIKQKNLREEDTYELKKEIQKWKGECIIISEQLSKAQDKILELQKKVKNLPVGCYPTPDQ